MLWDASSTALYRLQCHAEPAVLNTYRIWKEPLSDSRQPLQLLYPLTQLMTRILSHMTTDDGQIDYVAARAHPLYPRFEEAVCVLQQVNLADMDDRTKTVRITTVYIAAGF